MKYADANEKLLRTENRELRTEKCLRHIFLCTSIIVSMTYEKNLKTVISYLPFTLRNAMYSAELPREKIMEIHLISGQPLVMHTASNSYFINENNVLSENYSDKLIIVSKQMIDECFNSLCGYSVYSKQNEIVNGFLTLQGGNRAGICGTAVVKDNEIINIRDITSINIRVANEVKNCSEILLKKINFNKSVLLCGEPCSGKTTMLRDIARLLSYKNRVSLIDTRMELACFNKGVPGFDVGLCDVFTSYSKRDGFEQALRTMSPEYIICDEIGEEDVLSLINAQKSGARVIASAHCSGKSELLTKPSLRELVNSRCFSTYVFLKSRENIGQVSEIVEDNYG